MIVYLISMDMVTAMVMDTVTAMDMRREVDLKRNRRM